MNHPDPTLPCADCEPDGRWPGAPPPPPPLTPEIAATLPPDEVERRDAAWAAYHAAYHPDPELRARLREALKDLPDDVGVGDIVEVGPGPYRAPAVARALAEASVAYRTRDGLTQRDLARRLQVHQSQVARIEAGERTPELETLVRFARELGLTLTLRVTPQDAGLTVEGPEH